MKCCATAPSWVRRIVVHAHRFASLWTRSPCARGSPAVFPSHAAVLAPARPHPTPLLPCTPAAIAMRLKMDPAEAVRKMLQTTECRLIIPPRVLAELELLGPAFSDAATYARRFCESSVHDKSGEDVSASQCILDIIGNGCVFCGRFSRNYPIPSIPRRKKSRQVRGCHSRR
jgi:hypothetical protein